MATTFTASLQAFSDLCDEKMEAVLRGSVQDTSELMTRRAAGTTHGGTFMEGFVPVVTGELVNSQEVRLNGGVIGKGDVDYAAVVLGMELGDTVDAVFTADHGRAKEYGYTTSTGKQVPGWFFVRNAVQQWPTIVEQNRNYIAE